MTNEFVLLVVFLFGVALGLIFFGGLWWTVRKGLVSARPATWFLVSFILRTAIALAGFYLSAQGDWRRLVACLLGFIAGRVLVTCLSRKEQGRKEVPDAP